MQVVEAVAPMHKAMEHSSVENTQVEAAIERLVTGAGKWAALGPAGRRDYLKKVKARLSRMDFLKWSTGSAHTQGIDPSTPAGAAQIGVECVTLASIANGQMSRLATTLGALASKSAQPSLQTKAEDGKRVVKTFPLGFKDKYTNPFGLAGWGVHVHQRVEALDPAASGREAVATACDGQVCVVLGAGNQDFLTLVDCLDKLFVHACAVVVKHHPLREHQHPFFADLFAPLIEVGAFASVVGDASVGKALTCHPAVSKIHLTGGAATHDAIVWGAANDPESSKRRAANTPLCTKEVSSELGCVTPWLLVPDAAWTRDELKHHAWQLANCLVANASCNCLSPKALLLPKGWRGSDDFVDELKAALTSIPTAVPYYPGTHGRYAAFADEYPDAKAYGGPPTTAAAADAVARFGSCLPCLVIEKDDCDCSLDESCLQREAFAPVLGIVRVGTGAEPNSAPAFLAAACAFANERVWGSLSCTVLIHPATEAAHADEVRSALSTLRYGCVAINVWTALGYAIETAVWGGHPASNTLTDNQSGIGFVRNCLMLKGVDKCIVRSPFRSKLHITTNPKDLTMGPRTFRFMGSLARWIAWA